jgi:mannitol-specific phosphotransferase system IIBC component
MQDVVLQIVCLEVDQPGFAYSATVSLLCPGSNRSPCSFLGVSLLTPQMGTAYLLLLCCVFSISVKLFTISSIFVKLSRTSVSNSSHAALLLFTVAF